MAASRASRCRAAAQISQCVGVLGLRVNHLRSPAAGKNRYSPKYLNAAWMPSS